ncbi:unnamed protein product [Knipowitschia caucasica]|uniref:RING-type domain-containing protein n=1 Tax=Knipowitschia caucasica TaxID=637954 RepID=A0AAV2JH91_KNICA
MPDLDLSLLSRPVCLDLLDGPVTVACGHSFCRACILSHWGQQRSLFTCPLCLKVYCKKSGLVKNFVLSALVERLRAPPAGLVCTPPSTVMLDVDCVRDGEEREWQEREWEVRELGCVWIRGRTQPGNAR